MQSPSQPAPRGAKRRIGPFEVAPIGYGAMRLTGPNVFGPPPDREEAILLLQEAVDSGVDHIDTAEYYGPHVVNELIREALHPYPADLVLVSKVGARRDDRGGIFAYDEPAQLREGIEENLRTLGVDSLPVVNLRLMRAFATRFLLRRPAGSHDGGARGRPDPRGRSQQRDGGAPRPRAEVHRRRMRAERLPPRRPPFSAGARGVHPTRHRVRPVLAAGLRRHGAPVPHWPIQMFFESPRSSNAHPRKYCWPGP